MSEENSMDSISIAEDEDDIVKDNVAVTHEEESRWRSVTDLKMEKNVFEKEGYVVTTRPFRCCQRQSNHRRRGGHRIRISSDGCFRGDSSIRAVDGDI